MDTNELESKIREAGGEKSEEIIEKVRKLAKVDATIKGQMDEIENICGNDVDKHNKLATEINELVSEICDSSEDSDLKGKHEKPESEKTTGRNAQVDITVKVIPVKSIAVMPRLPLALMALMDFLNS
jgi:DNA anti-recombination protein RmuC